MQAASGFRVHGFAAPRNDKITRTILTFSVVGLYTYLSRSSPRGVSRALEARSGNAVGRSLGAYAALMLWRLKSSGSGAPAARHWAFLGGLLVRRVPTRRSKAEKVRQRRIKGQSSGGQAKESRRPIARGMPVSPVRSRSNSPLHFYLFVQRAVTRFWRTRHPARLRNFARAPTANPGANRSRERERLFEIPYPVVPAQAGTHNHRRLCRRKPQGLRAIPSTGVMGPGSRSRIRSLGRDDNHRNPHREELRAPPSPYREGKKEKLTLR